MQVTCSTCRGDRYIYDREGDREVKDVCYHCIGLGTVESEVDRQDRLQRVAATLGYLAEVEYRKACDSDPEGEGYAFRAAEHMQTPEEHFQWRVIDRQFDYTEKLASLDQYIQDALLEWHAQPRAISKQDPSPNEAMPSSEPDTLQSADVPPLVDSNQSYTMTDMSAVFGEDDIPF